MKQNKRTSKIRGGDPPTINITTQLFIGGHETGSVSNVKRFKESATLGDLFDHLRTLYTNYPLERHEIEIYTEGFHSGTPPIYIGGTDCTLGVVSHNPNENEILNKPLSCFFDPTTNKDDIHLVDWRTNTSPWAEWRDCSKPTKRVSDSLAFIRSRTCPPEPALGEAREIPSGEEEPLPADDSDDEEEKPVSNRGGRTRRRRSRGRSASSRRRKTVSRRRRKSI